MSQSQSKTLPLSGVHVVWARTVLSSQRLKKKAADEELAAKRGCAKALQTVSMRNFTFEMDGKTFVAELKRPVVKRINVAKLYTLVRAGEMALDDFLDCVTANETFVRETLGDSRTDSLQEEVKKGLDLIITEQ